MKKISLKFNKEIVQLYWQHTYHGLRQLPHFLFVRHIHALDIAAAVIVMTGAIWLFVWLLYLTPAGVVGVVQKEQELSTGAIDRLELWIDDRAVERRRVLEIPDAAVVEPSLNSE